jgi:NAD(P)-dependent dehydrogenase (short-subunit alcohol dehydrogenase family)
MPNSQTLLIACGERDASTTAAIAEHFRADGYDILRSEGAGADDIASDVESLTALHGAIDAVVYLSPPPVTGTVLGGGAEVLAERVRTDLEAGTRWLQAAARSMLDHRVNGRITLVGHITAAVPTQRFSYCSTSQLALMNLSRGAVLELAGRGIRVNTILRGWDEDRPDQAAYVRELRAQHAGDGVPLLASTGPDEVAKAALLFSDPAMTSLNGALLTLDGGFQISRKIRREKLIA